MKYVIFGLLAISILTQGHAQVEYLTLGVNEGDQFFFRIDLLNVNEDITNETIDLSPGIFFEENYFIGKDLKENYEVFANEGDVFRYDIVEILEKGVIEKSWQIGYNLVYKEYEFSNSEDTSFFGDFLSLDWETYVTEIPSYYDTWEIASNEEFHYSVVNDAYFELYYNFTSLSLIRQTETFYQNYILEVYNKDTGVIEYRYRNISYSGEFGYSGKEWNISQIDQTTYLDHSEGSTFERYKVEFGFDMALASLLLVPLLLRKKKPMN